jgi:hypothetical protein
MLTVYLIGSLRNPRVPEIAKQLRAEGFDVFDDWYAAGPEADDYWQRYEKARGKSYSEALKGYPAQHVYEYDKSHLDRAHIGVLVMPAGKSGHLELGYMVGQGKTTFILLPEEPGPDSRWDVMYKFANDVLYDIPELITRCKNTALYLPEDQCEHIGPNDCDCERDLIAPKAVTRSIVEGLRTAKIERGPGAGGMP